MTTNPTIDGVSREAIEQALLAMKRIYQAGYDRIVEAGGSCDSPEYMMEGDPTAIELRALLAAPVVERKEPTAWDVLTSRGGWYQTVRGKCTADALEAGGFKIVPLYTAQPRLAELQALLEQAAESLDNHDTALARRIREQLK